jgi:hypothetical protein
MADKRITITFVVSSDLEPTEMTKRLNEKLALLKEDLNEGEYFYYLDGNEIGIEIDDVVKGSAEVKVEDVG